MRRDHRVCGPRQHTYAQYADRVARLAGALLALGMSRGDRIGMLALNSDRYLEFFFGTWWGGGAVNPVNIRWSAAEIAYSLDDCDTRILLVDEQFKGMAAELRSRCKALKTLIYTGDADTPEGMLNYEALLAATAPVADAGCGGLDLAGVMYTGGTTGFPKGVMLSNEGLCANALAAVGEGMTQADGRALLIAPMFHIAAGAMMLGHATVGGTFVIAPMFTPLGTLQVIQQHRSPAGSLKSMVRTAGPVSPPPMATGASCWRCLRPRVWAGWRCISMGLARKASRLPPMPRAESTAPGAPPSASHSPDTA